MHAQVVQTRGLQRAREKHHRTSSAGAIVEAVFYMRATRRESFPIYGKVYAPGQRFMRARGCNERLSVRGFLRRGVVDS